MSTAPSSTVGFRRLERADEPAVLQLLTDAMAGGPTGERTSDFFRWKHRESPFGSSPGLVAVDGDRVVGVRMFLRWQLRRSGTILHGLRAVDTATHPDYLRRGIFKGLTLTLLEELERTEQVDLMFNTPNAASRPGYLRMGWSDVATLPIHVAPVRPVAFVLGMRGANRANASGAADAVDTSSAASPVSPTTSALPRADHAWTWADDLAELVADIADARDDGRLHTPLSLDYLRWRYVDAPGLDYRCVPVLDGQRLVGVGFGRLRPRASLWEFTLGDVVVRPGDRRTAGRVLRASRRSGAHHVTTHAAPGTATHQALTRSGFLRVPGNGIRLVANPRGTTGTDVLDPSAWSLALGDLEVF